MTHGGAYRLIDYNLEYLCLASEVLASYATGFPGIILYYDDGLVVASEVEKFVVV